MQPSASYEVEILIQPFLDDEKVQRTQQRPEKTKVNFTLGKKTAFYYILLNVSFGSNSHCNKTFNFNRIGGRIVTNSTYLIFFINLSLSDE